MDATQERADLFAELAGMQAAWDRAAIVSVLEPLLETDVTIQQLRVLSLLAVAEDGSSGNALATSLKVSMATISGILDRLEVQGLVERSEDVRDRRVRRVRATAQGRDTIRRLLAEHPQFRLERLTALSSEDLSALVRGMGAVLRVLGVPYPHRGAELPQ